MSDRNQEGYKTLGWIINQSEQGLFLVVADEEIQREIIEVYRHGLAGVYDYKRHPGSYSFRDLEEWAAGLPEKNILMIANFHLALQDEESLKRLNFSRDMLENLERNMIFFVTPYGDDRLAAGAYDFYSFVKLKITFHNYDCQAIVGRKEGQLLTDTEPVKEGEWSPEESREKMAEAYELIERAKDESDKAHYKESESLLLRAWKIKERLLGKEHLEMAEIGNELADVYSSQGKYKEAEELYKKSIQIREQELGIEHPDTVRSYNNLCLP